jgi:hypothetical protein
VWEVARGASGVLGFFSVYLRVWVGFKDGSSLEGSQR